MFKNLLTIFCLTIATTAFGQWNIYDGGVLPLDTMFAGSCNEPGPGFIEAVIDDPDIPGNKLLEYFSPDEDAKQAYKVNPDPWTGFTLVTRMKGYPGVDTLDRLFDFEIRNGDSGLREKFYINYDNTIELDNADTTAAVGVGNWHTYRVTMSGDEVNVYVDENPSPLLTGITTNSTSSYELKIADCSGAKEGALVDWVTWTLDGAYAPGTGPALPPNLATGFTPTWAIYDASVLPQDTMFGGSCNEPGPEFSETIIGDPDIAGNMLLDYFSPDEDGKQAYKITPDAWTGFTLVTRLMGHPEPDSLDRLFDFEVRNGDSGLREKLYINYDNSVELDNADTSAVYDVSGWHIYRFTMSGAEINVYIDENPDPILTGITTNTASSYELKVADCSGAKEGAIVDWITWTLEGAYAPGDGPALPAGLSTDFMTVNTNNIDASTLALKTYPNPFSESTNFSFTMEESADVQITVFDLMGKAIDNVVDTRLSAGEHQIEYPTSHLNDGVYIYRFAIDGVSISNKLIKRNR